MLADTAFDTYYILTENMIKDLILEDIEYNFIKNNNQENYSCSIPKFIIHKYWTNMLIRRRKSDYELWKNIL
ncbi:hypothetical protein [Acidiplasma cupricumulans]|nr:hypothetical protein [Acidiplasma cupricumulans]